MKTRVAWEGNKEEKVGEVSNGIVSWSNKEALELPKPTIIRHSCTNLKSLALFKIYLRRGILRIRQAM